jgi:hypothetical protein
LLKAIQTIDKMTFCLKAIRYFSSTNDPAHMGIINVIASEILEEVAPEIEAIKANAMTAATAQPDKYQPGDVVSGY